MSTIDLEKVCDELLLVKDRLMAADMGGTAVNCRELLGLVNSALDSLGYPFPPKRRNCDVGTAEEQSLRYADFCTRYYKRNDTDAECFGCPAECEKGDCEFTWGQLLYAEEVGDEGTGGRNGIAELSDGVLKETGCALTAISPSDEFIRRRDCINWSWDHCARTKCNYCAHECDEYRKYKRNNENG